MRLLAAVALLALFLAGCSGGDGGGGGNGGESPAASASSSSTTPPPPPLPTSDTLHFLAAPEMAPALPPGSTETATPVTVGDFGNPGGQGPENQGAEWRRQVERATNVTAGEVHVWVNVKETLLHMPDSPARPSCTWSLTVEIGADNPAIEGCIQEPAGPINPGIKELVFTVVLGSPIELETGETVLVRLERSGFSLSPNNAVDALSGSAEHDSRITLRGLAEPIRPQ
jgi:hypothetical protein